MELGGKTFIEQKQQSEIQIYQHFAMQAEQIGKKYCLGYKARNGEQVYGCGQQIECYAFVTSIQEKQ